MAKGTTYRQKLLGVKAACFFATGIEKKPLRIKEKTMEIILSSAEITELFDVRGKGTLTHWKRRGLDEAQTERGRWDAKKFLNWWLDNIYTPLDMSEPSIRAARLRYEKARAEKMETETRRLKGQYVPRADVDAAFAELITLAKRAFLMLPRKAPGILLHRTPAEQQTLLTEMVTEILTNMAAGKIPN